jgi:hypothetical protein
MFGVIPENLELTGFGVLACMTSNHSNAGSSRFRIEILRASLSHGPGEELLTTRCSPDA